MDYEKKQKIYKIVMLIVIVSVVTFLATGVFMYKTMGGTKTKYVVLKGNGNSNSIDTILSNFKDIINEKYLGEVNDEDLINGAIKGYIAGLNDPYTEYYTKEEMEEVTEETYGNFDGIGIYMTKDIETEYVLVLSPIEESPAEKAGVLPGDLIIKVDGEDIKGLALDSVTAKIKGVPGTKVKIEVLRGTETKEYEIERKNVKINHVKTDILENNIGYIKLSTFDDGCSKEFETKYDELNKNNIKGLIIDLRSNGGGIVDEALEIIDLIVDKNETMLITVDKNNKEEISKAKKNPKITEPIVILTNETTASASEILAGALKDLGKAKIIGTKTYGKGVIQELITLSNGAGIKITTNEYYTPNRNKINEKGIEPDQKVELPKDLQNQLNIEKEQDTQLQKAIEILK